MFKVNDYCLYNYNVCKVKEIVDINGKDYYVLVPVIDESLTVKAPITQENVNIRPLLSKKEVDNLIKRLRDIELITLRDQELVPEYKRLLNSPNREDLVKIIKTTYIRNQKRKDNGKKIGERDDIYFNLAEKSLYSELAVVLNKSFDEVKEIVVKELEKSK
jgi:CarD family transcriptional regulator